MSVFNMKPTFTDRESYLEWRKSWKDIYMLVSERIRLRKLAVKAAQRKGEDTSRAQKELHFMRRDAAKLMTLLSEAKLRRDRILGMKKSLDEQNASFPITIEADRLDFHFNKGHLEFSFLPRWIIKTKGKSYYVEHVESSAPFTTRELDSGSTLGMLRFRNCLVTIDRNGVATVTERMSVSLAA